MSSLRQVTRRLLLLPQQRFTPSAAGIFSHSDMISIQDGSHHAMRCMSSRIHDSEAQQAQLKSSSPPSSSSRQVNDPSRFSHHHHQGVSAAAAAGHGPEESGMLVDTLAMMKRYEGLGLSREQAEALTQVVTDVLLRNREMLANTYVSVAALEMAEMRAESSISGFRAEVMKIQELQEATSIRETERLQANLDKVKSEIRYEVDKLTASQRLDLNLEKGRMRDELQSLRDKSNELEIKVDKEVNSLKAAMEQSKNDTVKYMLGVVMALITAGLGAARLVI
jgi:hypothetical protein